MKIAVMGVGGVGGYYGSLLARHYAENRDVEVIFIARGHHLQEIRKNGLKMLSEKGEFLAKPDLAADDPLKCGTFDVVLFCTKSYDLEDSARLVSPCLDENSVVISLLNGVNNPERLRAVLHKGKILNGCVYVAAHILRPGVIQQMGGSGKLFFGGELDLPVDGKGIENILQAADIDAEYSRDIESIVWEKYIFICPFASATTFFDRTIGDVLDDEEGKSLLEGLLGEVIHIAETRGVNLQKNILRITIDKALTFPRETKTSMQKDAEDGKKTEIDTFTGYIVKAARKHGVSVPHHERVYKALKGRLQA